MLKNCKKMIRFFVLLFAVSFVSAELPTVWLNWERIIKGEDANEGEFPYMASLRKYGSVPGHACGASILTDTWALTAAHCCKSVDIPKNFYIYVGSIYLDRGGFNHTISRVILHSQYNPGDKFNNDICVIQVATPFKFSKNVTQITLAPKDWPVDSGDKVTISGWGFTRPDASGQKDIPNRLQKGVDFYALSQHECHLSTGMKPYPGHLCAKGRISGQSTWNGDSGGPLVKNGVQVGLTSFGFRPYGNNMPTVYARTTYYVDWIKTQLGPDASKLKFK